VRLADSGPVATAFWRLFLALPILFLFAWRGSPGALRGHGRLIGLVLIGGAFFAADLASWHLGIVRTKLANATLFGNSTSLILPLAGIFITGIWPTRMQWLALAIALCGAMMLIGGSFEASGEHVAGDLLCVLAGIFYVGYLLVMQSARRSLPSWWLLALSTAASAPLALLMALALGEQIMPTDWTPVVGVAFLSQVVGQGLLIYSLAHFTPLVVGLVLLVQPAVAAIIGWLAFGEHLSTTDFIGAAIIAVALVLIRLPAGAARKEALEE
jgi:drug/metabolite transporter (DMT)-like permease